MKHNNIQFAIISLITGLLIGAGTSLASPGQFLNGLWGAALIAAVSVYLLLIAWRWAGGGRGMAVMLALAYLLRLGSGIGLALMLPEYGYDEPTQNAGYVFYDAAQRDRQAWELAQSNQVLEAATGAEYVTDQYGGLLALSAGVYAALSPDAHRPLFIVLLAAFAGAVGVPFIYMALRKRFGDGAAWLAAGVFAFYPNSILLGASQMREPFLLSLAAIGLWCVTQWQSADRRKVVIIGLLAMAFMAWISSRVMLPVAGVLAVWFWLEHYVDRLPEKWRIISWILLAAAGLVFAVYGWRWVSGTAVFDTRMTEYNSGRIQTAIEELGVDLRVPFIIGYGLTQPVLPAALADPAIPLWRVTSSLLAAGWYAVAPFLIFALFALWREPDAVKRRLLAWSTLACVVWVLISSARAGGDQWDNPRYRTIFLPWLALICAWGWDYARRAKNPWLWRILAVEGIFLAFFLSWYLSRYYNLVSRMPFNAMLLWITALSLLVLAGGAVWDWVRGRGKRKV